MAGQQARGPNGQAAHASAVSVIFINVKNLSLVIATPRENILWFLLFPS